MIQEVLTDPVFSKEMKRHVKEVLDILLKKSMHFSIVSNISEITFEPKLPEEIYSSFKPMSLFLLHGYSFESCIVDDWGISFEAGFGHENFGSLVSIPLHSVLQVVVDETPILINLSVNIEENIQEKSKGVKRSMDALLSNPENEKFLK